VSSVSHARIRWLTAEEGGRRRLPTGEIYSAVARFDDPAGDWTTDAWSVVLRFEGSTEQAEVSFLVPTAPRHLIVPGARFEIFEGTTKVAEVEVL
jgi:hypothetical protein